MPGAAFLEGETVTLRTLEEEDLPFCRDAVNDPDVRGSIETTRPMSLAAEREWFEDLQANDDHVVLLICVDGEPVGTVGLDGIDRRAGVAEIGYLVVPSHWGNGYATAAVELLAGYAFDELRLNRVQAHVYEFNEASKRVLEKAGFEAEGVKREGDFVAGAHVDVHWYGLLSGDWTD